MALKAKRTTKYARRKRYLEYMLWIKTKPCICCGKKFGSEAAHCGDRPFGQKCSDLETLPICVEDHREGKHSVHKLGKGFWDYWKIDKAALFKKFQDEYRRLAGTELDEPAGDKEGDLCGETQSDTAPV